MQQQSIGCVTYVRPRRFRERLEQWLGLVRVMWPECPARISPDGRSLLVDQANALSFGGRIDACDVNGDPPPSDGEPKQSVNEEHLGERVALADPSNSAFPNHMHRLDSS